MTNELALAPRSRSRISWLDRLIMGIAPRWGLARVRARMAAASVVRHYEAAAGGRRTAGWQRYSTDANASIEASLVSLRELSRDLNRNNGWAKRALQIIVNNTIGWGITAGVPEAHQSTPRKARQALAIWNAWAKSRACDYDGRLPFDALQRLIMRTVVESGEALVVRRRAAAKDGLVIPIRLQVLEPDYLDTMKAGVVSNSAGEITGEIKQGIEFDTAGRRTAYWLYQHHPGASRPALKRFESVRVPADDVVHVYLVDRPGQVRGVPWAAAAIARIQDFTDWDDSALIQQKVASCFGAFVQDLEGLSVPVGQPDKTDDRLEELSPGQIEYLPPGKTISFAQPPSVVDQSFTTRSLRFIAAAFDVTYEDLTGDYSGSNFSSSRMARNTHWQNVRVWQWSMFIPQVLQPIWEWIMEVAAAEYAWSEVPTAEWSPPAMPLINPEIEGLAYKRLVRNGVMSLTQVIRERGEDPSAHFDQIERDNQELDRRGIVLDSDSRQRTESGGAVTAGAPATTSNDNDEDDDNDEPTDGGRLLS